MMKVLTCIAVQHDFPLVAISGVLCVAGCWVTARLFRQAVEKLGRHPLKLHLLAACTAGISIWCTHFVAMLGFIPQVPVSFDLPLTLASLLIAIVGSGIGLAVAASVRNRYAPAVGGAIFGLAVSGMHYAGMIAYRVDGLVYWHPGYLAASILMAVALSSIALCQGRRPGRAGEMPMTVILTAAIVSLHFTGMTAFEVVPFAISGNHVNPEAFRFLALVVTGVAILIMIGGFLGYLIESRTRRIAELTAARNAAEAASRAKTEFMSVLSHELRTPLTIVLGYAGILANIKQTEADNVRPLHGSQIPDRAELYGRKIGTAAGHLLNLINEILDYSRIELGDGKLERSAFPVSDLLREVQDQFQCLARDRTMTIHVDSEDIVAFADRSRCLQILINLAGNALKFSRSSVVLLRARQDGTGFRLEVEDRGCGIEEHNLDRIFEAFQQLETPDNRSESGTGLGLAICRKLAVAHGGSISVRSTVGQGTTFIVTFPASALAKVNGEVSGATPRPLRLVG